MRPRFADTLKPRRPAKRRPPKKYHLLCVVEEILRPLAD